MTIDKRTLLRTGLSASAALAAGASAVTTADADGCEAPSLGGRLSCDPHVLAGAADDFGHVVHISPRAVFKPASVADIAGLIRWAGNRGLKVVTRGQGHSTYGRAMADGAIVIDMSAINTIHPIQSDQVVVDGGATWGAVLKATLAHHRLTPPVLTNYLDLSVGGTLSVGGIGGATFRYGMQTDNVLALDVVTGEGRELTCSASSNRDLFNAVRAGLGHCGVITRATSRLMRAPERVRRFQLFYADLRSLTVDQRIALADGRFDHLQGAILPDGAGGWRYQLEGARFYDGEAPDDKNVLTGLSDQRSAAVISDLTYLEDASAFARLENLLRSNGQWFNPHPWLLTFLPGSNAEQVARDILEGLTNEDVGPFGRIIYYPLFTNPVHTPLFRLPDESIAFPFNIVRVPASNDVARAEQMIARNRVIYERIRKAGGVQYPVGAFPTSHDDWKDHFGPTWSLLHDARRRHDPLGTLTSGYNVF